MTALLGLAYNQQDVAAYWSHPFVNDPANNQDAMDQNNNSDNLTESSYILLSSNCLDCNYKSKRQRQAEAKLKEKLNIAPVVASPRVLPVLSHLELLSSILNLSDFNLTAQLGKGSFGTVFAAEFWENKKRSSPRKVAIKLIQTNTNKNYKKQLFNSFQAELNVKGLRHPNIISLLGHNECDLLTKNAFIIYELVGKINLKQFLLDDDRVLSISKRKCMSMDLIKAIEYIHMNNIIHMDIKPANIIVTNNLICKLTDFGCSIKVNKASLFGDKHENDILNLNQYEDNRWTAGTWFYRAPELFRVDRTFYNRNNDQVTFKCDIYSLGIVMWQLLTRESPYDEYHENPQVVVYQIVTKNLRPKFPLGHSSIPTQTRISQSMDFKNVNKTSYPSLSSSQSSGTISTLFSQSIKKSSSLSNENLENNTKTNYLNVNPDVLANTRYTVPKPKVDNSEFERAFKNLIEISWSNDPNKRYDAKKLKEILANTKISY